MLVKNTERGLFCEQGQFYIDPWQPVDHAVVTHAHSDHGRAGCGAYLAESSGKSILQRRLGSEAKIQTIAYGESINLNGVNLSLHPAGHILGSAQVRIEYRGEVWVVSGDYKLEKDGTCRPFELVRCHCFVTESTFGLPIYHWRPQTEIFSEINHWWRDNQSHGWTSVLFCYALGKAQRILSGLDGSIGPIYLHGATAKFLPDYERAGVKFPTVTKIEAGWKREAAAPGMVLAPMSAEHTPWLRKFGEISTGFASGWMQIRGSRRRRSLDRGFVMSDHADWAGLLETINATGAETIWVTHGYTTQLVRWLNENNRQALALETRFHGETEEEEAGNRPEGVTPTA